MNAPSSGAGRPTTVVVVQHDDQCPVARFGPWLREAGCTLDVRRAHAGDPLPSDLTSYDALLVLGGPMGAGDDATHPWLTPLKQLIVDATEAGLPTLGICLGHQLVATALGGTVAKNPGGQQLGLLDVGWRDAAAGDDLVGGLATPRRGLHWNDDVVTAAPDDATVLAATEAGEVQAVHYAARTWGVQLHPEADGPVVRLWAADDAGSHHARGIDQAALLDELDGAHEELESAWRPLAERFAQIATTSRSSGPAAPSAP